MRAVEALFVLGLACLAVIAVLAVIRSIGSRVAASRAQRAPWIHEATTKPDGTMVVQIKRQGSVPRVLKELPPGMDAVEFSSELQLAMENAAMEAEVLNRKRR